MIWADLRDLEDAPSALSRPPAAVESMFALDLTHSVLAAELDLAIIAEPSENPSSPPSFNLRPYPLYMAMQADLSGGEEK